jgi:hypothetical protein
MNVAAVKDIFHFNHIVPKRSVFPKFVSRMELMTWTQTMLRYMLRYGWKIVENILNMQGCSKPQMGLIIRRVDFHFKGMRNAIFMHFGHVLW